MIPAIAEGEIRSKRRTKRPAQVATEALPFVRLGHKPVWIVVRVLTTKVLKPEAPVSKRSIIDLLIYSDDYLIRVHSPARVRRKIRTRRGGVRQRKPRALANAVP